MTAVQPPHEQTSAMEDIHGVDVSWLHNSTRDHHHRTQAPSSPGLTRDAPPKTSSHGGLLSDDGQPTTTPSQGTAPAVQRAASPPAPVPASSATSAPQKIAPKRPAMLNRGSDPKSGTTPPDPKGSSRRNSWISSISSKFSSQNPPAQTTHTQAQGSPAAANGTPNSPSANGALNGIQAAAAGNGSGLEPYVPQPPKANFLSNALRRLSSGTQVGTAGKVYPNGGMCPRKVMNVDRKRARCLVPELDQNKLRKVAFCVDVEIAGGPKYKDDEDREEKKKKQQKDNKLNKRGEGEALKHPDVVVEEKETNGLVSAAQEVVGTEQHPNPEGTVIDDDKHEPNRKKEKKKRSEAERKERKEKKRRKAEENGSIPMEITRDDGEVSTDSASGAPSTKAPSKSQDRPTIDPLRIYRRCCQLRESPILKRISDQLSSPTACSVAHPGMVTSLDLTGSRLQLADVVTLSDWLAIVPVKKLFLEDADLNDEKIRVILAGILAARMPHSARTRSLTATETTDTHGCAIQKLVLKNNVRITAEGWKHIALFIYMCKSIIALTFR